MILKRHIKCIILAATMVWCCNMEAETALDSLNSVDPAKLKNGMVTSSLEALNGQAAGVQVQTQGNHEAMVSAVRVRGG